MEILFLLVKVKNNFFLFLQLILRIGEKGFVICVAFVSCALFSYSFNLIGILEVNISINCLSLLGEIINQSRKNKDKLKNDLEMLNNLMEDRGLNHELKSKVRRYFAYLSKENLQNYEIG